MRDQHQLALASRRTCLSPSSSSGRQSLRRLRLDGNLDDLGAGRAHRAGAVRQVGGHRRRNRATTARSGVPPVCAMRSSKPARHSTSTYSAPERSASPSSRRRSSSEPSNCPPSHAGRQVTIDRPPPARQRAGDVRIARPSRAAARPDRRRARASRRRAQLRRRRRRHGHAELRLSSVISQKKSLFNRSAEEARNLVARWQVRPRRMPLQTRSNTTTRDEDTARPHGICDVEKVRARDQPQRCRTISKRLAPLSNRMPISP